MSDYFDLDAVLGEEERLPTTLITDAYKLGFMDSAALDDDLEQGTMVELPVWLAKELGKGGFADVAAPKCYAHRFRTFLLADPVVINLRDRSLYYYETGIVLASFVRDNEALLTALVKTLSLRFCDILDKSQNSRNEEVSKLTRTLTKLETHLFNQGRSCAADMYSWKRRDCEMITSGLSKRKR
mmetsp:Transcript_17413/g.38052  ORF Transcript_17413/g.38052 Transcript_17413/m.38052 type:complete len:184 (+) Transcript_17413:3-554(+)